MIIQRIAPNAQIVEHLNHQCTFINASFIEIIDWAMRVQKTYKI